MIIGQQERMVRRENTDGSYIQIYVAVTGDRSFGS